MQQLNSDKSNGVSSRFTREQVIHRTLPALQCVCRDQQNHTVTAVWNNESSCLQNPRNNLKWLRWSRLTSDVCFPREVMLVSSAQYILRLNFTYVKKPRLMKETFSLEFTAFQQPLWLCQPKALARFTNVRSSIVIPHAEKTAEARRRGGAFTF